MVESGWEGVRIRVQRCYSRCYVTCLSLRSWLCNMMPGVHGLNGEILLCADMPMAAGFLGFKVENTKGGLGASFDCRFGRRASSLKL